MKTIDWIIKIIDDKTHKVKEFETVEELIKACEKGKDKEEVKDQVAITRKTLVLYRGETEWKHARVYSFLRPCFEDDEKIVVNSLEEFIEIIRHIKVNSDSSSMSFDVGNFFLFRGMATDDYKLVGRIDFDRNSLRERITKSIENNQNGEVISFVEAVEKELFKAFKGRGRAFVKKEPKNDWEWLALARHFGVPTRILDWSRDPLVALWFAVQDEPMHRDSDSVVYVFEPRAKGSAQKIRIVDTDNFFTIQNHKYKNKGDTTGKDIFDADLYERDILLYRPPSIASRIDYQSSWFSLHPFIDGRYLALEPEDIHKKNFRKIYISADKKYEIRKHLKLFGIDEASIIQDLDGLGKYLKNKFFKMSDEFFSDESLQKKNIVNTFKKLQSLIGLYNSIEVKEINYVNVKSIYSKLNAILYDKDFGNNKKIKLWTFNNVKRNFGLYKGVRLPFIDIVDEYLGDNKIDYKRVNFIFQNSEKESFEEFKLKFFNHFLCYSDKLTEEHCALCNTQEILKYLVVPVSGEKKLNDCSFFLLECGNGERHLVLEFNNEILGDIIEGQEIMCFWLTFKTEEEISHDIRFLDEDKLERSHIFNEYAQFFSENFNLKKPKVNKKTVKLSDFFNESLDSITLPFDYDELKGELEKLKVLYSGLSGKEHLKISYKVDGSEDENILLIPITDKTNFFFVDDVIRYIYEKLHKKLKLQPYSYYIPGREYKSGGTSWGLYFEESCKTLFKLVPKFEGRMNHLAGYRDNRRINIYTKDKVEYDEKELFKAGKKMWLKTTTHI